MSAVVEAIRPIDGTQDAEASRMAIRDALSDLLTRFPDAELLNLDDEQRSFAVERYVGYDVFRRFQLDLGKHLQDKSGSAAVALARLKDVRDYIMETVAAAFRKLASAGRALGGRTVMRVVTDALRDALQVFEGYAQ